MTPLAALRRIAEHYEARSELYTSDTGLSFGMFQIARSAIAAATGTAKTAKPVECEASQSGGAAASPDPRRIA